MLITYEVF